MAVRLLDDALIDQIAAGEVVERPASVVKELVENALDAGATTLRIRLDEGGKSLIRITDDGHGMDEHDAVLCLERHATSKIRSLHDLVHVRSLGFRGEAIPSIASVSRFELLTRRAEDDAGVKVQVEGGTLRGVSQAGCAPGTRVTVRSLFYNLPVRKAFLRTAPTELGHCLDAVTREVLVRPDVDVLVTHGSHEVLRAPAAPDLQSRARALIGKVAQGLRPVAFQDRGLEISGLISPVGVHQGSNRGVHLYVNGRHVRDPVLRRALREAYQGIVPRGRHPVVVLQLTVPDERVDVNVHPSKTEVRFHSPRDVVDVVSAGLSEALRRHGITRQVKDEAFGSRTRRPDPSALPLPLSAHPADDPALKHAPPPKEPELPPWLAADLQRPGATEPSSGATTGPSMAGAPPPAHPDAAPVQTPSAQPSFPPAGSVAGSAPRPQPAEPAAPARLEPLALLDGTLGLARRGQELLVVDGLALRAALARDALEGGGEPQRLLVPRRLEPGRALAERLLLWAGELEGVGVSLGSFGPGVVVLKRLPACLLDADWDAVGPALARSLPATRTDEQVLPGAAVATLAASDTRPYASIQALIADVGLMAALDAQAALSPPIAAQLGADRLRDLIP